jgi:hypothetical protein
MAKHKTKIIAAAAVALLLAGAWLFGGNYSKESEGSSTTASIPPDVSAADGAQAMADGGSAGTAPTPQDGDGALATAGAAGFSAAPHAPALPSAPPSSDAPATASEAGGPEKGGGEYLTDPVPAGRPLPVEPQDAAAGDGSFTVTLSVRCDTLLSNMDLLDKEKRELVPDDGVIFPATAVTAYEGESVFNVLRREMKRAKIHMEFMNTPIYNSAYIEGLNNLYEFDAGELSGWTYKVNGWFPNYGSSRYLLKAGDAVEWAYTCDLGRDVNGGEAVGRGQRDE